MSTSNSHNEEELFVRMAEGDEQAFAGIFRHYHQRVYHYALRFVPDQDAKDVAAESFIQLWNKRSELKSASGIAGFLFVAARNRCYNILRQQMAHDRKHAELLQQLEASEEPDLFIEQVRAELIDHIREEVERLPARMKEIFLLSFEQGLKPAEIAAQLKISVQTVSNQKLTAVRLLKAALGSQGVLLLLLILNQSEKI